MKHLIIAGMLSLGSTDMSTVIAVPSQAQILACQADAHRLCGAYLSGPIDVVRACMLAEIPHLSKHCREAIEK